MYKRNKLSALFLVILLLFQNLMTTSLSQTDAEGALNTQLSLMALTVTDNAVEMFWTSSQNNIKAASYEIYRNDSLIKSINSFLYTDLELTPETNYTYLVKAKDAEGNVIAVSNPLSIITLKTQSNNEIITNYIDYVTDRIIIKYKNDQGREKLKYALEGKIIKGKDIKIKKDVKLDVVSLNEKVKIKDFMDELKGKKLDSDIEYIQPDFQLELSSNDPYFSSQWGLENKGNGDDDHKDVIDEDTTVIEKIRSILPHIADEIEKDQECLNFFISTPADELWMRIEAMDVPGNLPSEILMELSYNPMLRDMMLNLNMAFDNENQIEIYLCDAGVTKAWENTTGSSVAVNWENTTGSSIAVAVIDTGIEITHEDLAENIWINTGEISGNSIDDDCNGYIDDINGWNFCDENNVVYDGTNMADENHGTHIAGTISAIKDNGVGIAGIAPAGKIMPLKVFRDRKAYTSDIIEAIQYAEAAGVKIINCSWGTNIYNPALKEAIQESDMLFICAAGNSSIDIDTSPVYPASFDLDNIITVSSVDRYGSLSAFSNYGATSVDVAAPGNEIQSTLSDNNYGAYSGTSMAAAFVTGEAVLLKSASAGLSIVELKDRIIGTSEHLSCLIGKVEGGNKINCNNALSNIRTDEIIPVLNNIALQDSNFFSQGTNDLSLFSATPVSGSFTKVSAGGYHTLALKNDDTVWACGYSDCGQLGDGTTTRRNMLVQVSGLSDVVAIAGGYYHSMALKNDGTVYTWGYNKYGQLGDGTTTNRNTPVQVSGLTGITSIACGYYHSIALKSDGTVYAWGLNNYGQIGDGTTVNRGTPVKVSVLSGITAIAGGGYHSLALKNDGTVYAWGYNCYGQVGDGTTINKTTPVQVSGLSGITAITGGFYYSLVLRNDGTVYTWGYNNYGQLGDGTTTNRSTPVQVTGLNGIIDIAVGGYHSLALKNDDTVYTWGYNAFGQLGDGTVTRRSMPVQVIGLSGVICITAGHYHSFVLKNGGTGYSWGSNNYGQLGDGTNANKSISVQVSRLSNITAVAGEYFHSLALKNDGTVYTWGYNDYSQLGDGTVINKSIPVQVGGLSGIAAISSGQYHSLALKNDGTVYAWGYNNYGQLGDGTTTKRSTPVQVNGLSGIIAIASGGIHSLALKNDGTVYAWGCNNYGQLGDGTSINRSTPVKVNGLSGITAISGGHYHSLALKNDGTVYAWGYNEYGQLGDGTNLSKTTPVQVNGLSGITAIAGGYHHSLALKSNGTVYAWGYNNYGQLGDGTATNRNTPVQVSVLSGITAIAGGNNHNVALKDDGSVYTWGYNTYGQLGDGTVISKRTPVKAAGLSDIGSIAAGYDHSLTLKNDGTVYAWGYNMYGQLGNGEKGYSEVAKWVFGIPSTNATTITLSEDCMTGVAFNLSIYAKNVVNFEGKTFTIAYIPGEISSVVDLCAMTKQHETSIGLVPGTGITITQISTSVIQFTVDKPIDLGKSWSGVINVITFVPAINGSLTLTVTIE